MKRITPRQNRGKPGFRASFYHPQLKKVVGRGLDTRDKYAAEAVCRKLEQLCDSPEPDAETALRKGHDRRAVAVFYAGTEKPESDWFKALINSPNNILEADIRTQLLEGIEGSQGPINLLDQIMRLTDVGALVTKEQLIEVIGAFEESRRIAELEQNEKLNQDKLAVLEPRAALLETENQQLRQRLNLHVKVKLGKAVEAWSAEYNDATRHTKAGVLRSVNSFVASLHGKAQQQLSDVVPTDIDKWLAGLKRKRDGKNVSPTTRKNNRANLSVFLSWATRRYNLSANPMDRVAPLTAHHRSPEQIRAIHRYSDLVRYLETFDKEPYWHTWVAVACLAGPRFGEQLRMKLDDVDLHAKELRILASKTGRFRRVPIEQSILLPVLRKHVQSRKRGEWGKSEWLFPSTVPPSTSKLRTVSPADCWSHNGVWQKAIRRIRADLKPHKTLQPVWSYKPAEWRHTFGTALGQCGWTSREIAKAMGNSEAIADRFYVAATSAGLARRWPLQF